VPGDARAKERAALGHSEPVALPLRNIEPETASYPVARPPSQVEFDAIYRTHVDFVWRSLRRLGVREAALDDATQEVFIVVHRRFSDFRPGSSMKAWLFAIAQRTASDQRRWVRRKGNLLPLHEDMPTVADSPLEGAITRQASDIVMQFLEQLDESRRVAFILSDLEQMTAPEIGAALGVNLNTIYYRVASARKAFVAFLEQRGIRPAEGER
jgi:RNA polymerase sigma-70 factor, ECF subfamily